MAQLFDGKTNEIFSAHNAQLLKWFTKAEDDRFSITADDVEKIKFTLERERTQLYLCEPE